MRARSLWLDAFALAALGFATSAATPSLARANETRGGEEPPVAAREEQELVPPTPPAPASWLGRPVDVTPRPWWRGTGEEPWRFNAAGYLWLPDAPAQINLGPVDATLREDLGTILDSLQFAMMMDFEARKGRFGGYVAPIFVWLRDDDNFVQGPIRQHQIIVSESVYLIDFGLSYEVGQWRLWNRPDFGPLLSSPAVTVEPFVGARSLIDDITVELKPGGGIPARPSDTVRPEISFITPVVGARLLVDLTDRFNIRAEGDYGGFGGVDGVDTTWNAAAFLAYRFKPRQHLHINVFAGYRQLHIEYKKVAAIKVDIKGPFLGLAFQFAADGSGFVSPGR